MIIKLDHDYEAEILLWHIRLFGAPERSRTKRLAPIPHIISEEYFGTITRRKVSLFAAFRE